jgi:tetratricopeptide (TPR) repeat protein
MHANPEADLLIREGAKLIAAGAPNAQEPLERAVALAPDDPDIIVRAACLSYDNEHFDRARELVGRSLGLVTPEFDLGPALANVGGLLAIREGHRDEGLMLLQAAFDDIPPHAGFGYELGAELLRAGRLADAAAVVRKAIDSKAPDEDLPRLLEHIEAIAAAEAEYADGGDVEAAVTLADALEVFDRERSRDLFETVLRNGDARQRALAAFNLGVLHGGRDRATAQRYYEQALAGEESLYSAAAAYNLGGLLLDSDPVQARGMFERAAASTDPEMAALAREQLAALS